MHWYCWQTNTPHLAHAGGLRGVLSIGETLSRGASTKVPRAPKELEVYSQLYYIDHMKESADEVIASGVITSHGSKLHVHYEMTTEKYEVELAIMKEKAQMMSPVRTQVMVQILRGRRIIVAIESMRNKLDLRWHLID
jgi:hypothetical protein